MNKPRLEATQRRIKRSGLVEATIFPRSVQAPEFIMTIAEFYDPDTRKCPDAQGKIVIDLSPDMLGFVFGIPTRDEIFLSTEKEALKVWTDNVTSNKRHMNENWLEEKRKIGLKATEILRANFKEPQRDLIIMLRKAFGKPDCKHFHPWMFQFMTTILLRKQYFDWPQILLDNICRQMKEVHRTKKFFFTSYVIWVAPRAGKFPTPPHQWKGSF